MEDSLQVVGALVSIAITFVGVLVWLIRRQAESIERLTDRFVTALETTVTKNTEAQLRVTNSLAALETMVREDRAHSREEHRAMLDALGKVGARTARSIDPAA